LQAAEWVSQLSAAQSAAEAERSEKETKTKALGMAERKVAQLEAEVRFLSLKRLSASVWAMLHAHPRRMFVP
jgi:hypothetical protein